MSNNGHIEKTQLEKRIVENRNKQETALGSCRQLRASHLARKFTQQAVCCLNPVYIMCACNSQCSVVVLVGLLQGSSYPGRQLSRPP